MDADWHGFDRPPMKLRSRTRTEEIGTARARAPRPRMSGRTRPFAGEVETPASSSVSFEGFFADRVCARGVADVEQRVELEAHVH